jgi:outer membrane protein TolC
MNGFALKPSAGAAKQGARYFLGLLFLGLSLALGGCAAGNYDPSALKQAIDYDPQEIAQRYHIDRQWWSIYADPQLDSLLERALDNNIDLLQSAISVNKALYQANILGADLVPEFSGAFDGSWRKEVKSSSASAIDFSSDLSVSYELDLWRRLADRASAQEWEHQATRQDLLAARLALINNVIDAYFHIIYLENAQEAMNGSLEYYRQINTLTQFKYQQGKVPALEPALSAQAVLSCETNVLDLREQHKAAQQTLRELLNLLPADELNLSRRDLQEIQLPEVDLEVPLSVLALRPDVLAAEYRLQSAFNSMRATEKSIYPSITIGAALTSSDERAAAVFDLPFMSGIIALRLPFLHYNRLQWEIAVSRADFESSLLSFTQAINTALNELDYYYYSYASLKNSLEKIEEKYIYDTRIAAYYQARYQAGAGELSDWLNAMRVSLDSKLSALRCRYQLLQRENMIYKAMAGRYEPK